MSAALAHFLTRDRRRQPPMRQGRPFMRSTGAGAHTDEPRLRYLAGGDAQLIGAVRKQTDFEGFEAAMRRTLDWHD